MVFGQIASLGHFKTTRVSLSNGIGYDKSIGQKKSDIYIGYFQSWIWASDVRVFNKLMNLKPQSTTTPAANLIEIMKKDKVLICHIRLKDYLGEDSFGIPTKNYYENAIEKILTLQSFDKILIFSDSPESCLDYFPAKFEKIAEVADDSALNPAEVLHCLRFASAYVIANSTFSWWGAFLRFNRNAPVIAPNPWFKNGQSPVELVPHDWIKIDAFD